MKAAVDLQAPCASFRTSHLLPHALRLRSEELLKEATLEQLPSDGRQALPETGDAPGFPASWSTDPLSVSHRQAKMRLVSCCESSERTGNIFKDARGARYPVNPVNMHRVPSQ